MGRRDQDLPFSQSAAASPPESSASLIEDYFRQVNTLISSANAVHSSSMTYDKRSTTSLPCLPSLTTNTKAPNQRLSQLARPTSRQFWLRFRACWLLQHRKRWQYGLPYPNLSEVLQLALRVESFNSLLHGGLLLPHRPVLLRDGGLGEVENRCHIRHKRHGLVHGKELN